MQEKVLTTETYITPAHVVHGLGHNVNINTLVYTEHTQKYVYTPAQVVIVVIYLTFAVVEF